MASPQRGRGRRLLCFGLAIVPVALWYAYAWWLLAHSDGSRATAGAGQAWLKALGPLALLHPENAARLARFLLVRAFTPLALPLLLLGSVRHRAIDRFWTLWAAACGGMLLLVAGKLHHEYYLLALAPAVAVGMACGLEWLRDRLGNGVAVLAVIALGILSGVGVRSTWHTPAEWRSLPRAAVIVRSAIPPEASLVAPEALLYAADRRGARLEIGPAALRAAAEWGGTIEPTDPLSLLRFYQSRGLRHVADLTDPQPDANRLALQQAVRRHFTVRYDASGILIADLNVPGERLDEPQGATGDRAGLRPLEARRPQDRRPDGL